MKCRRCGHPVSDSRRAGGRRTCGSCLPSQRHSTTKAHRGAASATLTPEEWQTIFYHQNGECWLCHHRLWNRYSGEQRDKSVERLGAVDHCHIIEKKRGTRASIRGIICAYPCNRILRREMTAGWLYRAAAYVQALPAQAVLASVPRP